MALQSGSPVAKSATVLNSSLFGADKTDAFKKEYNDFKPYPLLRLDSFLKKEFIPKLESSLDSDITFAQKDNDLFKFYQSYGLEELPPNTPIQDLIKSLYSQQFIDFLYKVTGKKVQNKPDLFASCYKDTSYLLCHDDQVEDRSIAFILYLVPEDWSKSDGGALNIYNSQSVQEDPLQNANSSNTNKPKPDSSLHLWPQNKAAQQLLPKRNSVVIFEVSDKSFHAVDEVVSDKNRITIAGWWRNGKTAPNKPPISDPIIAWKDAIKPNPKYGDQLLQKWVNPTYLKDESIKQLQDKFGDQSFVTLMEFINVELYYKLLKQMFSIKKEDKSNRWALKGPIHRRLYYQLALNNDDNKGDTSLIEEFNALMASLEWKAFIEKITGVNVLKQDVQMRRFEHGNYTIAHDLDRFKDLAGLDVVLQLVESEDNGWDPMCGGSTYYTVGREEDEGYDDKEMKGDKVEEKKEHEMEVESEEEEDENILMRIHPFPNTLSLVYRSESGVMSFVKYINHHAPCSLVDVKQTWTVKEEEDESTEDKKRKENVTDVQNDEPPRKKQKV